MKKSNKKKIDYIQIVLIVLSVIFVLLVVYELFISKMFKLVPYTEEEISEYITKYGFCSSGYKLDLDENKTIKYEDLSQIFINSHLYSYLKYNGKVTSNIDDVYFEIINETNPKIESFSRRDLKAAFKVLFGKAEYEFKDKFDLGEITFTYDKKSGKYISTRTEEFTCPYERYDGFVVDKVSYDEKQLNIDVLYFNYELQVRESGCFRFIYYGTKDDEELIYNSDKIIKEHPEHFYKYRFVYVPYRKSYVFDHIEFVKE